MPEGHKTHFIAGQHNRWFGGNAVKVTSPQGRFRGEARKVSGKQLERVWAAGKHLFYEFEQGLLIHIHLGRYGKFRQHDSPPPAPVGQVRMRMVGDDQTIDLTGPTTCRVIDDLIRDEVLAKLGPDPLAGGKKADVWANISSSGKPIGGLLLDQAVIAGVGNIFRAEILFETSLDPTIPGNQLSKAAFDDLWKSLNRMMKVGLKYGKIISVTAKEVGIPLAKLEDKDRFRVYRKTHCPRCHGKIQTLKVASRSLYVCPQCQKRRT